MARVRGAEASAGLAKRKSGGAFFKLEDGESVDMAFVGELQEADSEPLGVEVVWIDTRAGRRSVEYDPDIHREDESKAGFLWNVFIHPGSDHEMAGKVVVFSRGPRFFKKWNAKRKQKGLKYWWTVSRVGAGQNDTEYMLDRDEKLSDDELKDLNGLELKDLDESAFMDDDDNDKKSSKRKPPKNSGRTKADEAPRTKGDDRPTPDAKPSAGNGIISADQASELRAMIKSQPDAMKAMSAFKEKFSVDKLKDLPNDQYATAESWVKLLSVDEQPEAQQKENDPFD